MLRAPRRLPSLEMLLADLNLPARDLAHHLGVTERTIRNWKTAGDAPRAVILALYWESRWGLDNAITGAHNTIQVHREHAKALAREMQRKDEAHVRLSALADAISDSANSANFRTG